MSLHARIKQSRIKSGLSQALLAKKAGVSQPTVANWETGSHIPRRQALSRIASALDVDPIWLLSGDSDIPAQTYLSTTIQHVPIFDISENGEISPSPTSFMSVTSNQQDLAGYHFEPETHSPRIVYIVSRQVIADTDTRLQEFTWLEAGKVFHGAKYPNDRAIRPLGQLVAKTELFI